MAGYFRIIASTVVLCVACATFARADVIRLTKDQYQASASVTIVNPITGLPETWSSGPVTGSVFGQAGVNPFSVSTSGTPSGAPDPFSNSATTQAGLAPLNNEPGQSGFIAHALGDGQAQSFSFDTHFDSYLAFVVSGQNTSMNLFAERSGTHAASGYRLVDFTTGTTLLDRMLSGPVLPAGTFHVSDTIGLNDQHAYGLWTSAAALDMTDPFAGLEIRTNADIVPTPEPASLLLLGSTAAGLIYRRRRAGRVS
jgi:hypothetical protein